MIALFRHRFDRPMRRGDLAQSEQYYCKEPVNFLYMGSMFRFREKGKER